MELLQINIIILLEIWAELIEAFHGVNGFGGNVAEIYAYRFQNYSPMVHGQMNAKEKTDLYKNSLKELNLLTGKQLCKILFLFQSKYECKINVNDIDLKNFYISILHNEFIFNHRVHVKIIV